MHSSFFRLSSYSDIWPCKVFDVGFLCNEHFQCTWFWKATIDVCNISNFLNLQKNRVRKELLPLWPALYTDLCHLLLTKGGNPLLEEIWMVWSCLDTDISATVPELAYLIHLHVDLLFQTVSMNWLGLEQTGKPRPGLTSLQCQTMETSKSN